MDAKAETECGLTSGVPSEAPPPGGGRRCGLVAIVGRANVGKSTLLNALMQEKVSIVSPVPQTTRHMVRGVLTEARGQLVFLDTPGVHKAEHDLGRLMNRTARRSIEGVDMVLLVLDGESAPREEDEGWLRRLAKLGKPFQVVLNKAENGAPYKPRYQAVWETAVREAGCAAPVAWLNVSALTGLNVDRLRDGLFDAMPVAELLFPEDMVSDFPRRWHIADVVREKLFEYLYDEIPHDVGVLVEKLAEHPDHLGADVLVYVDRPTQKGIVLGERGRQLKGVKWRAEHELTKVYEQPVRLNLWVKVEKNWARNHWILKQMGYV